MFAHRATNFAAIAVTGAALGLAALAGSGTAGAFYSADDAFLADIENAGISYDDPDAAVSNALAVCDALGEGYAPEDIALEILSVNDITIKQAAYVVVASVDAYCPSYDDLLA